MGRREQGCGIWCLQSKAQRRAGQRGRMSFLALARRRLIEIMAVCRVCLGRFRRRGWSRRLGRKLSVAVLGLHRAVEVGLCLRLEGLMDVLVEIPSCVALKDLGAIFCTSWALSALQ